MKRRGADTVKYDPLQNKLRSERKRSKGIFPNSHDHDYVVNKFSNSINRDRG